MSEGGKRSAWLMHVKKTMKANRGVALRDVLKIAKKTYKGGQLAGRVGPMGGARKLKGGQLYSFAGGPYADSVLADGAAPFKFLPDSTWQGPSELKGGAHPLAPVAKGGQPADVPFTGQPTAMPGGRRKMRKSKKTRRGGVDEFEVGNPGLSTEEQNAISAPNPSLPAEEEEIPAGGRRRKSRKSRGRYY